jgi:hypothetical protein
MHKESKLSKNGIKYDRQGERALIQRALIQRKFISLDFIIQKSKPAVCKVNAVLSQATF